MSFPNEWTYLSSTNLNGARYDKIGKELQIEFKGGGVYTYRGVEPDVYEDLVSDASPGSFFHDNIKNAYPYRRG